MNDGATTEANRQLSAKVLEFDRIISSQVRAAKEPAFSQANWAPLADLIAVDIFERVGIWRERMSWQEYTNFLTRWAASKGFETTVRRISEVSPLVYDEVEERHFKDDEVTIVNSMSVFEFDDDGKICHLDVYLQGELYAPGTSPDYTTPKERPPAAPG